MNPAVHLWHAVRAIGFATYKEWAAYRSHMAVSLLVGPVYFLVQYMIWHAIYEGKDTINGLTLAQMLSYFGIAAVVNYFTFDFADWNLQMLVRTGKFVTFALRPMPHWLFALAQKLGHRSLGFAIECAPVFLIFLFVFHIDLKPAAPGWAAISIALSFLMNFMVNYCVGLTAFWLVRAEGVRRVFLLLKDISAGLFVPLSFFPGWAQHVLFYLPFQFITYVPTRVYVGKYELAGMHLSLPGVVGLQAGATALVAGLMLLLYRQALRRFTGVGV
ncbi:ABC-2 family transporter protein [Cohnella sp. REN36]|uniref:ABC transporter permease n=1 Tax=Cohnella sp. REN36 TaxID=2887347 RepID=UPI001D13F160|nr:ABC-2 family transporter protein [Cohnella sp. REN36]MCC3377472.1 ABC-2 family transporter protein [Cohnella sp. REN36]